MGAMGGYRSVGKSEEPGAGHTKKFGSESITLLRGNRKIPIGWKILKGFLVRCNGIHLSLV
jgi:hypothetical protein